MDSQPSVEDFSHFAYPELSEELSRADRPWRRLWSTVAVVGLIAAVVGGTLLWVRQRSTSAGPWGWLGPSVLVACAIPSALALLALRSHPEPPDEAWISTERVVFGGPGRRRAGFRWSEANCTLDLLDLRSARPTWAENGSRRTVEFVLWAPRRSVRSPPPADAVEMLVRVASSNGFSVRDLGLVVTRRGPVRRLRLRRVSRR